VAASFLAEVPSTVRGLVLDSATRLDVPAGRVCFRASDRPSRGAIVVSGLARTFVEAGDGRRLTLRYVRSGAVAGLLTGLAVDQAPIFVQAVTDCRLLELPFSTVERHAQADAAFAWALARETSRRLLDATEALARATFGTLRERLSRHLLDLAEPRADGALAVEATQQDIADGIGTVREVVARALRDMRSSGLVETRSGRIVILNPDALAASAGGWQVRNDRRSAR
jgi:CRP/FNR family transcriptional regulator, cyclic AMP receptor protein